MKNDSLDIDIGADDILNLLWKRILEGEGAGSHPGPFSGFGAEAKHHWQNLALQLHHLRRQVRHDKHSPRVDCSHTTAQVIVKYEVKT